MNIGLYLAGAINRCFGGKYTTPKCRSLARLNINQCLIKTRIKCVTLFSKLVDCFVSNEIQLVNWWHYLVFLPLFLCFKALPTFAVVFEQ